MESTFLVIRRHYMAVVAIVSFIFSHGTFLDTTSITGSETRGLSSEVEDFNRPIDTLTVRDH